MSRSPAIVEELEPHQLYCGECMDYFSNTGAYANSTISTKPNSHDFAMLKDIYAHLDSTTTVASAPGPVTASQPGAEHAEVDIADKASSWGALVKQSANGRSSIYARQNQNGSVTLTHVYWTLEAAEGCASCDHRRQYPE